jgi:hypothetical protein
MRRKYCVQLATAVLIVVLGSPFDLYSQSPAPRSLPAKRTTGIVKIDGLLTEDAWKDAAKMTDLIEFRPKIGDKEDFETRTEAWLMYDDNGIYFGGYCHERTKDSISSELKGRDGYGANDYVGIIFDTYYDKLNGFEYFVTPLNEQWDAKMSAISVNGNSEDFSWNAVWKSGAVIHADGWSFEMFIPYSAIRFGKKDVQTWGFHITRRRRKTEEQFTWNPVNPNVNGFLTQEGLWTGISHIKPPVRLQFSPYFSAYVNHYPYNNPDQKNWTSSINGGMDVKYGISQAITLDMTLIPDFGQVQSDNQVLNLSPFEVKFNENRSFFTEGTELFSKGNLFYSRRVGGVPIHHDDIQDTLSLFPHMNANEHILKNPTETKLINATKISGRFQNGLGIGYFNSLTAPQYATVEDDQKNSRKIETSPLTNYNIVVLDQSLKHNSSVTFINTNVMRSGGDYDANVSAVLFDLNDKSNTWNVGGKVYNSNLFAYLPGAKTQSGYSHVFYLGKTSGNLNFVLEQDLTNKKYSSNDLGYFTNNNFLDHYFWMQYHWLTPSTWYNNLRINFNNYYSVLYKQFDDQKFDTKFQVYRTNVNANAQLKNLWVVGMFVGYVAKGNDFYEPHQQGWSFHSPQRIQFNPWFQTNTSKKYWVNFNYFFATRSLFNSPNHELDFSQQYRFNNNFSIEHELVYNPTKNDAGFYSKYFEEDGSGNQVLVNGQPVLQDIIFSRRDLKTVSNILLFKYSFNNKAGITFRARHYWSQVRPRQLYDLRGDGTLTPTVHTNLVVENQNYNIFNIDATYTWEFAPGSFVNIVWKNQAQTYDGDIKHEYFKNFSNTMQADQNNNFSIKVIYFLDYLTFKHRKKQH